jgi:hypothetical protein
MSIVLTRKRVFLSFLAEDKQRVDGLRLLAANPNYDLEFYDESLRVPIESNQAEYVKKRIKEKINRPSITVCLISENTHTSRWVDWELEETFQKANTIVAMALKGVDRAVLPRLLKENNITFWEWDPAHRNKLISEA